MKRLKKIMAMLLLMLLVASPVVLAASQPVEVQAKRYLKTNIMVTKTAKEFAISGVQLKLATEVLDFTLTKMAEHIMQTGTM